LKLDQFLRESFHRLDIGRRPASVDFDVTALRPPDLSKFLPERREPGLRFISWIALRIGHKHADQPLLLGLLRVRRERPCNG